jgi:hypothetical protein
MAPALHQAGDQTAYEQSRSKKKPRPREHGRGLYLMLVRPDAHDAGGRQDRISPCAMTVQQRTIRANSREC